MHKPILSTYDMRALKVSIECVHGAKQIVPMSMYGMEMLGVIYGVILRGIAPVEIICRQRAYPRGITRRT
jgi:hypothetical protein